MIQLFNPKYFCDIKDALKWIDRYVDNNFVVYGLGRNKMRIFTGILGFVREKANFYYHAILLVQESEEASKKNDYVNADIDDSFIFTCK